MINIVSEQPGWVCHRIATTMAAHLPDARVSFESDKDATANVYMPYYMARAKTRRDIPWFTHFQEDLAHVWNGVSELADVCLAQSKTTAKKLPAYKTWIWQLPPDAQFKRDEPLKLGICGRAYARKGLEVLDTLKTIPGVEIHSTDGRLPFESLPAFYRSVDYILVTSDNEGGPMCVPEALAMGKPVIAPDVGWCWEFPVIRYGTKGELHAIVTKLANPSPSWDWAAKVLEMVCLGA